MKKLRENFSTLKFFFNSRSPIFTTTDSVSMIILQTEEDFFLFPVQRNFWIVDFQIPVMQALVWGVCLFIFACLISSSPNQKRYRPEIRYTYPHIPYLKKAFFCFLEKITVTATSHEKLPCQVDFPHIFSIALFFLKVILKAASLEKLSRHVDFRTSPWLSCLF